MDPSSSGSDLGCRQGLPDSLAQFRKFFGPEHKQGNSENNEQMHGLKQSFKHTTSVERVKHFQSRVSENAGAATDDQIQRLPRQQEESLQHQKPRRTESASTASRL